MKFYYIFLFFILISCGSIPTTGNFTDHKPGTVSFAGHAMTLNSMECLDPKGRGKGNYIIKKDSLLLTFENKDYLTLKMHVQQTEDMYLVSVQLLDEMDNPVEGEILYLLDVNNQNILTEFTKKDGMTFVQAKKVSNPKSLQIMSFGSETVTLEIKELLGESEHNIKRCLGFYSEGDQENLWIKFTRKGLQYKKKGGRIQELRRVK